MEDFEPAEFGPNVEVGGKGAPFKVRFVREKANFRVSQCFFGWFHPHIFYSPCVLDVIWCVIIFYAFCRCTVTLRAKPSSYGAKSQLTDLFNFRSAYSMAV